MDGYKKIAWQREYYCIYAEITLELNEREPIGDFMSPTGLNKIIDSNWRTGILFSLALIQGKLPEIANDIQICINSFNGEPGDTTIMAVAYVTYHAIVESLAPQLADDFTFDEETAEFRIQGVAG